MPTWLVTVLEKLGWRCSKCNAWGTPMMDTKEEVEWGTNVGDILFMDPHYVKTTTCHCERCNHLMFKIQKPSDKKVEVGR